MHRLVMTVAVASVTACSEVAVGHDLQGLGHKSIALSNELNIRDLIRISEQLADTDARYVYSRLLLWNPGQKLKACFINGTEAEKQIVVTAADRLLNGKDVNITFGFGSSPHFRSCSEAGRRSDIRVSFSHGCCAAYIGRTSHHPDVIDGPSVFLQGVTRYADAKAQQTLMHELLHALGLNHEHQSPDAICEPEFIKEKVLRAYRWTEAEFKTNLKQLDHDSRKYKWSTYDPQSIMKYFFDTEFLTNGTQSPCYSPENYMPSGQDYEGLRDAYPVAPPRISPQRSREIFEIIVTTSTSRAVKDLVTQLRQLSEQED